MPDLISFRFFISLTERKTNLVFLLFLLLFLPLVQAKESRPKERGKRTVGDSGLKRKFGHRSPVSGRGVGSGRLTGVTGRLGRGSVSVVR